MESSDETSRGASPVAGSSQASQLEGLGRLAGGIAHDFNNLLGVILNCSTLLGRRLADPAALADLHEIHLAAEQAVDLTRALLAVAGRDSASPELLRMDEAIRTIVSTLEANLGEQLQVDLQIGSDPLVCVMDETQLERIVTALATNARDAMPAGGSLTIRLRQATGAARLPEPRASAAADVVLEVVDTGCGMTAEVARRAPEPFFTTKPRGIGTGLGLAVVYGLVQQNAGEITIDSVPGAGTTVTIVLPGDDRCELR